MRTRSIHRIPLVIVTTLLVTLAAPVAAATPSAPTDAPPNAIEPQCAEVPTDVAYPIACVDPDGGACAALYNPVTGRAVACVLRDGSILVSSGSGAGSTGVHVDGLHERYQCAGAYHDWDNAHVCTDAADAPQWAEAGCGEEPRSYAGPLAWAYVATSRYYLDAQLGLGAACRNGEDYDTVRAPTKYAIGCPEPETTGHHCLIYGDAGAQWMRKNDECSVHAQDSYSTSVEGPLVDAVWPAFAEVFHQAKPLLRQHWDDVDSDLRQPGRVRMHGEHEYACPATIPEVP